MHRRREDSSRSGTDSLDLLPHHGLHILGPTAASSALTNCFRTQIGVLKQLVNVLLDLHLLIFNATANGAECH